MHCVKRLTQQQWRPLLNSRANFSTATKAKLFVGVRSNSNRFGFGIAAATLIGVGFFSSAALAKEQKATQKYKHVIVGAGVSARSCLATLNEEDKEPTPRGYAGKVLMIGNDSRMNSIGYSEKDQQALAKPTNNPENNLLLGHHAVELDVHKKTIELQDGTIIAFDKCFLATGGIYPEMKNVEANAASGVTTFRRTEDLTSLLEKSKAGEIKHVSVVGGGTLGTEIALELKDKGGDNLKVTQLYAEPGTMHRNLPDYFRAYLTALLRSKGIDQRNFSLVSNIGRSQSGRLELSIDSWDQYTLETDHIVFAPTHIDANTSLADDAGMEIDINNSGIMVNCELQGFSDVYVGGDAASYPSPCLGRRRDQNYDHAVQTGSVAAKNMLGQRQIYNHIPIAEINMKSINMKHVVIGNADARLETIGFWEMNKTKKKGKTEDQYFFTSKYNKGAVFYMDHGRVVGVLLTNLQDNDDVDRARQLIKDRIDYSVVAKQDVERELREAVGFELQVPLIRSTFGKGNNKKGNAIGKHSSSNPYKRKRHANNSIARHPSDLISDANTNLYWKSV